jgi:hypothetical protein
MRLRNGVLATVVVSVGIVFLAVFGGNLYASEDECARVAHLETYSNGAAVSPRVQFQIVEGRVFGIEPQFVLCSRQFFRTGRPNSYAKDSTPDGLERAGSLAARFESDTPID